MYMYACPAINYVYSKIKYFLQNDSTKLPHNCKYNNLSRKITKSKGMNYRLIKLEIDPVFLEKMKMCKFTTTTVKPTDNEKNLNRKAHMIR